MAGGGRDAARPLAHLAALPGRPRGLARAASPRVFAAATRTRRRRSRSRSPSGGATSATGRRSTRSTWRSWRTTCASRSRRSMEAGLSTDEAFLVAVKRMGDLDSLSREFAREHSDRLWKQLVVGPQEDGKPRAPPVQDAIVAFGLAAAAAVAIKVPALFGLDMGDDGGFYARNPELLRAAAAGRLLRLEAAACHAHHPLAGRGVRRGGVLANVYPFEPGGSTEVLTALHLPIVLWLVVGVAYAAGRWRQVAGRMDFIRFSGELIDRLRADRSRRRSPHGLHRADLPGDRDRRRTLLRVVVAAVRSGCGGHRRGLAGGGQAECRREHGAGTTRLFTPFFAAALLVFLGTLPWTGRGVDVERTC